MFGNLVFILCSSIVSMFFIFDGVKNLVNEEHKANKVDSH